MTDAELAAIKARAEAATAGPWMVDVHQTEPSLAALSQFAYDFEPLPETRICAADDLVIGTYDSPYRHPGIGVHIRDQDAAFIAAARSDIPALIAEVERLRAALRPFVYGHLFMQYSTRACAYLCVHCAAEAAFPGSQPDPDHAPDCPVTVARTLLSEE